VCRRSYLTVGVAQLFYQFWPHTQLIGRMGFLDCWIQTPSNHRVHHAQNGVYLEIYINGAGFDLALAKRDANS
jgi:sterol desaturase/sphingolipid hydroxylase (fatty acid hydroxylase superfamily)